MQIDDYKDRVSTHDFAVVGKDIYFFSLNYNGLYCLHMPQRQLEFLGSVPGEGLQRRHLYGAIIEANGKLYMPPMNGKQIVVYDIKKKKFNKIALQYEYGNKGAKFFGALYSNGKIFFIPCWYPYLVVLDLNCKKVIYLDEWYQKYSMMKKCSEKLIRNGFFIKDKILYMASMLDNSLIEISTDNYETKIIKIGNDISGFVDMCLDEQGNCIWFLKKNKPVIERCDLESFETKSYKVMLDIYKQTGEYPFIKLIHDRNRVYLISFQSNMSVIMNKDEEIFFPAEWDADSNKVIGAEWEAKNYFAKKIGKDLFIVGTIGDLSFCIIRKGKLVKKFYLEDYLFSYRCLCQRRIVREDEKFDINSFLKMVNTQQKINDDKGLYISYGNEIYQSIKKHNG